ncbi:MAG: ATP-binding protein [Solobacterium sp.]|nr:ATP-binding protein [Solobacterium sp.]
MKEKIIGRVSEIERLDRCMDDSSAQLIIVYGRRRVGKTFLINEYFDNNFAFKITGAYQKSRRFQLEGFHEELMRKSGRDWDLPSDWRTAFRQLREYLESLPKDKKQVVFFDEMPWLDTAHSDFLAIFEWLWNDWASTQNNLVFIVCGSATAWMIDHISENKGGLFNRQSCRLYLEPFTLAETEMFLHSNDITWSRYEIAECYMIMGGIPYYLNLLDRTRSYTQNIDHLFFKTHGELWDEFNHLYRTLFTNSDSYIKVVEALSTKKSGLTRNELIKESGLPSNGTLTRILSNLVSSGFVRVSSFYGNRKKEARYQLSDYYTAFYFRFIKNNYGNDEHFWSNTIDNPARRAWAGLTFEQLCKDHIAQIKHKLGISGVLSQESVWYTSGDRDLGVSGAQIDLIIDRRDQVSNLCEMKYSINEYVIDKEYDQVLRNKLDSFRRMTGTKKTLQLTMITTYGVKQGKYSSLITNQVVLDDLFHD